MTGTRALAAPKRLPVPHDRDIGAAAVAELGWPRAELADLLAGAAGSSPYLAGLIRREGEWLEAAADDVDAALASLVAAARGLDPARPEAEIASSLRGLKRRVALLVALADLGGIWPLEEVTGALTRFADAAVAAALAAALHVEHRRRHLSEDLLASHGGMFVLAMGKMGAFELNYSSDIDLVCLFDDQDLEGVALQERRATLVRATRRMTKLLSEQTAEGYVFRTDLRLRPDPAVTPVCMAAGAAELYYESLGRSWERAAYVKARVAAGNLDAGARFLETLRPFVWRRHLDFAAIRDAHDIRLRIRSHKARAGPPALPGHDIKLGRGGIREIEFFTQTRQIIAGGRDPSLRVRGTVEGLHALARKGWVSQDVADTLMDHYRALREVEHRLQMIHDAQTHRLPETDEGFARLAALSGTDAERLKSDLAARLAEVDRIAEAFFTQERGAASGPSAPLPEGLSGQARNRMAGWLSYPALRSARAAEIFTRLQPLIAERLSRAADPDEAFAAFDRFLAGLPAGVQLFSLFEANPHLVDLLAEIVTVGPELAGYLSRNAQVFDAVIAGDFFAEWPGRTALEAEFAALFANEPDYEARLDAARRRAREWRFRIGVHLLRGLVGPDEAARQYADLAAAVLAALWPVVQAEFARRHGPPPGRGAVVLALGSLGAGRLNARSDLDLIVIYDPLETEASSGPRPLEPRRYYARLTQALVTALSAPTAAGRLYEVDMRLRPSGNQGPVATSWAAFRSYQQNEAWTWEHMALTRARVVAGPEDLAADVEAFRRELLARPVDPVELSRALSDMRARIAEAHGAVGRWEPKRGRGRLQDIELFAQAAALAAGTADGSAEAGIAAARDLGWTDAAADRHLRDAHQLFWALRMADRLVGRSRFDPDELGRGGLDFVLRLTGAPSRSALDERIDGAAAAAGAVIDDVLARLAAGGVPAPEGAGR